MTDTNPATPKPVQDDQIAEPAQPETPVQSATPAQAEVAPDPAPATPPNTPMETSFPEVPQTNNRKPIMIVAGSLVFLLIAFTLTYLVANRTSMDSSQAYQPPQLPSPTPTITQDEQSVEQIDLDLEGLDTELQIIEDQVGQL